MSASPVSPSPLSSDTPRARSAPQGPPAASARVLPGPGAEVDPVFPLHLGGKIDLQPTVHVRDRESLSLAYTPGVARVSEAIAARPDLAWDYTWKGQTVAIVTDGTAVLGLGDVGPLAALPVMEGKALLFKEFGGLNAVPLVLDGTDVDGLVDTIVRLAPGFGGINLEDIAAPRCFEVETQLQQRLDIPVFHDDQHGTAIVTLAALRNAAKVTGRAFGDLRVVVSGAGAAGTAITLMLLDAGVGDVCVLDRSGILRADRPGLSPAKAALAARTNRADRRGGAVEALRGADVLVGVSGGVIPEQAVAGMADDPIVFAMANPTPEVDPQVARRYARVVATGRSDYPNQINNVLAFPGVFRGALAVRARAITDSMKRAAARALADVVADELDPDHVVPSVFDERVVPAVAQAVADAALSDGVARR